MAVASNAQEVLIVTLSLTLPIIGVRARDLLRAIAPSALAALAMAVAVHFASPYVAHLPPPAHLGILVALGGMVYFALLWRFARPIR